MKKTLRHKAYEEIKKKIVLFELKPGEKISDVELCAELGMGRTPVREALLILEKDKLIQCHGKRGYFVRRLTQKEAEEYFEIRTFLELFAVPAIISGATGSIIKELEANIKNSEECAERGDLQGMAIYNTKFHEALYQATRSEAFIETLSGIFDKLHWLRTISLRAGGISRESLDDHKKIVSAIKKKDSTLLEKAIQAHLQHAKDKAMAMADIIF